MSFRTACLTNLCSVQIQQCIEVNNLTLKDSVQFLNSLPFYHWFHGFCITCVASWRGCTFGIWTVLSLERQRSWDEEDVKRQIAIGVLTSNKGGRRRTTLADWTWHQGATAGCSGRGAIAGGHCRVPLQGAIVVCYGRGGGWRPTLGEWTWFHCRVPMAPYTAMASRKSIQKTALSFLLTLHRSLHWQHKNCFLLYGVYAGIFYLSYFDNRQNLVKLNHTKLNLQKFFQHCNHCTASCIYVDANDSWRRGPLCQLETPKDLSPWRSEGYLLVQSLESARRWMTGKGITSEAFLFLISALILMPCPPWREVVSHPHSWNV